MTYAHHIKGRDGFPICGRADFHSDEFVEEEWQTDCWECASIADVDEEQLERNKRTDLCDVCKEVEHQSCSLGDIHCSCCRSTVDAMEES